MVELQDRNHSACHLNKKWPVFCYTIQGLGGCLLLKRIYHILTVLKVFHQGGIQCKEVEINKSRIPGRAREWRSRLLLLTFRTSEVKASAGCQIATDDLSCLQHPRGWGLEGWSAAPCLLSVLAHAPACSYWPIEKNGFLLSPFNDCKSISQWQIGPRTLLRKELGNIAVRLSALRGQRGA